VTIRVGHGYPLTWGAHGRALVAFLPDPERDRVLAGERLSFWGEADGSPAERAGVGKELEDVRRAGYAKDLGRVQAGIHAVAAPLFGAGAGPIGAVILVGTFPKAHADDFGRRTAVCAKELGALLGSTLERVVRKGG
jgi:DNA-binding IclR family transcriptional regulator